MTYKKIPVGVEAQFLTDGSVFPRALLLGDQRYQIDRVMHRGKHHPFGVSCIAPVKYIIIVSGQMKSVYFEPSTMQWFTVKEIPDEPRQNG
ncbi:MAG: hypothetical protein IJX47_05860 [Clostridia bacterium]|nr:hypothetical protein [Clostridia bacterium]